MEQLEPRKEIILRAVIIEYVSGAEPVASELLTVKYSLGVKSATVRNELAEMSDIGLLEKPHTSAGRIPSDLGYRYYVDHLADSSQPSPPNQTALRGTASEGDALNLILQQSTRTLSRMTHLLSAATTDRGGQDTIRSAVVSAFGPHQSLVVLGLSNGEVLSRIVECPSSLTLADVGAVNETLTTELVGKSVRSVARLKVPAAHPQASAEKLLATAWSVAKSMLRLQTNHPPSQSGEKTNMSSFTA
jgi:heat-inducible transcriptional repressor